MISRGQPTVVTGDKLNDIEALDTFAKAVMIFEIY